MVGIKDEPNLEEDGLGIEPYANALCEFIKTSQTPMTIGVQGPWGSGKTSLLRSVEKELSEDEKIAQIWVNSWEHSLMCSSEETLIKITNEIAKEILSFDKSEEAGKKLKKITGKLLVGGLAAGAAITAGAKGADLVSEILSDENGSPIKQLKKELENSVISVSQRSSNPKERFVIYIDDLDRIEPSDAVSILELLKNIFSVEQCVFVLAIDYEVVVKGLSKKFGQRTHQNEREYKAFFDKVIQLTFKMPMNNYDIGKYVYQLLDKTEFLKGIKLQDEKTKLSEFFEKVIALSVKGNPRSIKRLVNSLTLMAITAEKISRKQKSSPGDIHEKQLLFSLVCLQISMPDIYALIAREPEFYSWTLDTVNEDLGLLEIDENFEAIFQNAKERDEFDEEWEQALLKFGHFKGYKLSEITDCSKLLAYLREEIVNDEGSLQLFRNVIKQTSVTSISRVDEPNTNNDLDPVVDEFWTTFYSYLSESWPEFERPTKPKKAKVRWKSLKNRYQIMVVFRKQKRFISVYLENYKHTVNPEQFQADTSEILKADGDFNIEIQSDRKRMDVIAIKTYAEIEDERSKQECFEWMREKITSILNNSSNFQ